MSLEQQVAALVTASNNLTGEVAGKIGQIDARVATKTAELDQWKVDNSPERRLVRDITIGGSKDFFYPVWWSSPAAGNDGPLKLTVCRSYHWNGGPGEQPLNPGIPHQAGLLLEMESSDVSWGGDPKFLEIKRYAATYNQTVANVAFQMLAQQFRIDPAVAGYGGVADGTITGCMLCNGLYLRGGGLTYRFISNLPLSNFGYHDGTGQPRNIGSEVSNNVKWVASPLPFADGVPPATHLNAFVDPV